MSERPTPKSHSLAPWLVLLVLPAAAAGGWLLGGKTPIPDAQRLEAPAPTAATAAPVARGPDARTTGFRAQTAPVEAAKKKTEEPRAELSPWSTFDDAVAESKRNGKPILIDFNAEWCPPCRRMKQQVFDDWTNDHAVRTAVIPVSIVDRSREEGRNPPQTEFLQQRFQVDAFPTLVVFSPASGRATRTKGFGSAQQTLDWIAEAAKAVR